MEQRDPKYRLAAVEQLLAESQSIIVNLLSVLHEREAQLGNLRREMQVLQERMSSSTLEEVPPSNDR